MRLVQILKERGFTLIELLATLTVMAIISMMIWPYFGNYSAKARRTRDLQGLRAFEEAMDRHRALNLFLNEATWGSSAAPANGDAYAISDAHKSNIIEDVTAPGEYQTLKTGNRITVDNLVIVCGGIAPNWEWQVLRYREDETDDGVNREGEPVSSDVFLESSSISTEIGQLID